MTPNFKKIISFGALALLFVVIIGYAYFRSSGVIKGVRIVVEGLEDGQTVATSNIVVKGHAKHAVKLTLNDRPITTDEEGAFYESLLLPPGYTIIKLHAEDKFGKTVEKTLQLVLVANTKTETEVPLVN